MTAAGWNRAGAETNEGSTAEESAHKPMSASVSYQWLAVHQNRDGSWSYNYLASKLLRTADSRGNYVAELSPAIRKWQQTLRKQLSESQEFKGGKHRQGSWYFKHESPNKETKIGGRLYHTTMAILTMQADHRLQGD